MERSNSKPEHQYDDTKGKGNEDKIMKMEDFYDIIIYIDSILSLIIKGWDIFVRDPENIYLKLHSQEGQLVAVVGNQNKGKTWLLGQISKSEVPSAFFQSTPGISVKYFLGDGNGGKSTPVIGFDTQGSSRAVDISETKNYSFKQREKEFLERVRDSHATEDFLQSFIMHISPILICVVHHLNCEDQILVERLASLQNQKKTLIVVHNLFTNVLISEVEDEIENSLKKGFVLNEQIYSENIENCNTKYYVEPREHQNITHLILAKEGSQAGDYYNKSTLVYLNRLIKGAPSQSLNIFGHLMEFLKEKLANYANIGIDDVNSLETIKGEHGAPTKIIMQSKPPNPTIYTHNFRQTTDIELPHKAEHTRVGPNHPIKEYQGQRFFILIAECPSAIEDSIKWRLDETENEWRVEITGQKGILSYKQLQHKPDFNWGESDENANICEYDNQRKVGQFICVTKWYPKQRDKKDQSCFNLKDGLKKALKLIDGNIILVLEKGTGKKIVPTK